MICLRTELSLPKQDVGRNKYSISPTNREIMRLRYDSDGVAKLPSEKVLSPSLFAGRELD